MEAENDALALLSAHLSPQEKVFCDTFVSDPSLSIAGAVRAAGFAVTDSRATAFGESLLKKQAVQRYLAYIHAERLERHRDIRDGCLQALWVLASAWDIKDLIGHTTVIVEDEEGNKRTIDEKGCLPPDELPPSLRAAVKEVSFNKGRWSYKFVDKTQILMLLLKHFGDLDKNTPPPPPVDAKPKTRLWDPDTDI